MSTLTRTNSHSKKPRYKDYVSFLDSYSKKDDHDSVVTSDSGVNFSLTNSSNNSSSSVFSDISDGAIRNGFNNNKNIHPGLPPKGKEPKQTVKTEMFIEIKNPTTSTQSYPTQVFEVQRIESYEEPTISVSSAAKIFEQKDSQSRLSLKARQNSFKKGSIGEISRKFETSSHPTSNSGRPQVRRAASIGEATKIFEKQQNNNKTIQRPKNFNAIPKPFLPTPAQPFQPKAAPPSAQPLQPTSAPKLNTEIKTVTKPAILSPKPVINAPHFPKFIPDPPKSYADSVDSALSSLSISPSPPQCASPPPQPLSPPPPPPPLPSVSFAPTKPSYNGSTSPPLVPRQSNGVQSQQITVQTNGHTTPNGTLDKNDPRVKKAVYGALRNMYGAYHDQANDYLSTLPKNRVRKNNGLDSIIDSIASQGGLDKLTGRVIPKQEAE